MEVQILQPKGLEITQTDKYDPQPETQQHKSTRFENTWHLIASTTEPSKTARFLTVFCVYRQGEQPRISDVEFVQGEGAIGVMLTNTDGTADTVAFRTEVEAEEVSCGQLRGLGRVFARSQNADGKTVREMEFPDRD
jgi:hypothetical protein